VEHLFNFFSEIDCEIYLVSIEELVYNELIMLKFIDGNKDKNERLDQLKNFTFTKFADQEYYNPEYETILSIVKNFGK